MNDDTPLKLKILNRLVGWGLTLRSWYRDAKAAGYNLWYQQKGDLVLLRASLVRKSDWSETDVTAIFQLRCCAHTSWMYDVPEGHMLILRYVVPRFHFFHPFDYIAHGPGVMTWPVLDTGMPFSKVIPRRHYGSTVARMKDGTTTRLDRMVEPAAGPRGDFHQDDNWDDIHTYVFYQLYCAYTESEWDEFNRNLASIEHFSKNHHSLYKQEFMYYVFINTSNTSSSSCGTSKLVIHWLALGENVHWIS
jgi:hypothetical protein